MTNEMEWYKFEIINIKIQYFQFLLIKSDILLEGYMDADEISH